MSAATARRPQLPPAEIRDAWSQYLEEVRGLHPARYDEVEPWAWERLQARLRRERGQARSK